MKRLSAILLLGVLFFNIYGYRIFLNYMDRQATAHLEMKLDAGDYNENDLVEIKLPINLPYQTDWIEYEPYYGQVNLDGKYYQYVKRKLSNDTLYLLCIPHHVKTKIHEAKTDYFKSIAEQPLDGGPQPQRPSIIKLLQSEFLANQLLVTSNTDTPAELLKSGFYTDLIQQFDPLTPSQPPELSPIS